MEITQHSKYTCTFCGRVSLFAYLYLKSYHGIPFNYDMKRLLTQIYFFVLVMNRMPSSARLLVSGAARDARRLWLVVPGLCPPLLLPLSAPPPVVSARSWRFKHFLHSAHPDGETLLQLFICQ